MHIIFNGLTIARSCEIDTKNLGWTATLPPNAIDSKNKPYAFFNLGLAQSIEWVHIMTRYYPD